MRKLILIACLIVSKSAIAAFPVEKLDKLREVFMAEQKTLTQLRDGLPLGSNDWESAMAIDDISTEIDTELEFLSDLGVLYAAMLDARDARAVSGLIDFRMKWYGKTCERNLKYINKTLARINSKAIVSTSEKLRENIQQSCDYVKLWH
jgi:hypothetical protein